MVMIKVVTVRVGGKGWAVQCLNELMLLLVWSASSIRGRVRTTVTVTVSIDLLILILHVSSSSGSSSGRFLDL